MNLDALGLEGDEFEMDIERGKVREFAKATFAPSPEHYDGRHPVAPPTFLTTMFGWEPDDASPWRKLGIDPARTVQAGQEYVFHGPPPRAGDRLIGRSRIAEMYTKEGRRSGTMQFVVMVTEFRDESGRLVAEARITAAELERPTGDGGG